MADRPCQVAQPDVMLWTMPVDAACAPEQERWLAWLDETERARAARFVRDEDRALFIAAHALARAALATALRVTPGSLRFEADGMLHKPRLVREVGRSGLRFSLSHCQGLATVALARGLEIGLDAEPCDRQLDLETAQLVLTPQELASCAHDQSACAARLRLRAWVRKESAVKAIGLGLSQDMLGFAISGVPPRLSGGPFGTGPAWSIEDLTLPTGHLLAVTAHAPAFTVTWRHADPSLLGVGLRPAPALPSSREGISAGECS